ncbi:MAG: hypothetical protein Q7J68_01760 [Thermoplasmata archaeon]|nr:hypothetical protein [Thermoplasmata archaeon]
MNTTVNPGKDGVFFHITFETCLPSILENGLLPARDAAKLGFEQPYPSDPNYIYLFNRMRMQRNLLKTSHEWMADRKVLSVKLPTGHPIEREYDQAQIPLRLSGEALEWFLKGRASPSLPLMTPEKYVKEYFKNVHGLEYEGEMTMDGVRQVIDACISDAEWAERDGCYRTSVNIHTSCISAIPWGEAME